MLHAVYDWNELVFLQGDALVSIQYYYYPVSRATLIFPREV